jgi:hypothetical protein
MEECGNGKERGCHSQTYVSSGIELVQGANKDGCGNDKRLWMLFAEKHEGG